MGLLLGPGSNTDFDKFPTDSLAFPQSPALVEAIFCPAEEADMTTESLVFPTTSLVLDPNPNTPCHVFPRASRTA